MKRWIYLIAKFLVSVVTFVAIFIFPAKDFETDLAKATLCLGVIMILELFENKKPKGVEMNELQEKLSEVSQNTVKLADKILLEYMQKKGLTIDDLQGNVAMQHYPFGTKDEDCDTLAYWYKGELILKIKQKIDITQPLVTRCVMSIEKGDW